MVYKIIACDFDGTLANDKHFVDKQNIKAIKEYKKAGGNFIIATGRLFSAIKPHLASMDIVDGPIICHQGSTIFDVATSKPIYEILLPYNEGVEIVERLEKINPCIPIIFYDDCAYTQFETEHTKSFCKIMQINIKYVGVKLSDFIKERKLNYTKILCMLETDIIEKVAREIDNDYEKITVSRASKNLIEIVNKDASKGNALKWYVDHLGLEQKNTVAIGDAENDISMLKYAGLGIAVDNAMENVKSKADKITVSNNDYAVSVVIGEILNN